MNRERINSILLGLGMDIWGLRRELEPSDPNYVLLQQDLRMKSANVLSATLLSDAELKKYLIESLAQTANELDELGLFAMADHIMPRLDGFFFRKNYDYGEGWHDMVEKFREGKIKSVKDWLDKRRAPKKKKRKKKSHHVIGRGFVGETGYIVESEANDGLSLGSGGGVVPDLNSEIVKVFSSPEAAERGANALINKYEQLAKESKKRKKKKDKEVSYPSPFDSYCDSKRTRQYWMEMKKDEGSDAIEDFLNYIKEIKCPPGELRISASRKGVKA